MKDAEAEKKRSLASPKSAMSVKVMAIGLPNALKEMVSPSTAVDASSVEKKGILLEVVLNIHAAAREDHTLQADPDQIHIQSLDLHLVVEDIEEDTTGKSQFIILHLIFQPFKM